MGTIIGQPERIAVEFEIFSPQRLADEFGLVSTAENDLSSWIYGYMCLWAGGRRIGRHDEICAMTVAMSGLPMVLRDKGKRSNPSLMRMPARAAFRMIHGSRYGNHPNLSYCEVRLLAKPFERFAVLDFGFDIFDGWRVYLVEDRRVGRLIWQAPDRQIHEARIGAGEFDRVIDQFLTALEQATGYMRRSPRA